MPPQAQVHWKPNPVAAWIHLVWSASLPHSNAPPALRELAEHPSWPSSNIASPPNRTGDALPEGPGYGWQRLRAEASLASGDWESFAAQVRSTAGAPTAAWLEQAQQAVAAWQPQLTEGLETRVRPLKEQWEARAPGFIKHLAAIAQIDMDLTLELSLVPPALGGYAVAHLSGARPAATMEAMLYHPNPEIPEPVRVGWLLAQWSLHLAGKTPAPAQVLQLTRDAAIHVDWISADTDSPLWSRMWRQHWETPDLAGG